MNTVGKVRKCNASVVPAAGAAEGEGLRPVPEGAFDEVGRGA